MSDSFADAQLFRQALRESAETPVPEDVVAMARALERVATAIDGLPYISQLRVLKACVLLLDMVNDPDGEADGGGG